MINDFRGKYRWLSNFHLAPVYGWGMLFPATEHAYMAGKCKNPADRKQFLDCTAVVAKRLGKTVELRDDWNEVRIPMMRFFVYQKFIRHPDLTEKLLNTGDQELVEGNTWNDTFWGVCNGVGENNLGKILMAARTDLRERSMALLR